MKNDLHIAMMKRANALIKSASKLLDDAYDKHKASEEKNKKAA